MRWRQAPSPRPWTSLQPVPRHGLQPVPQQGPQQGQLQQRLLQQGPEHQGLLQQGLLQQWLVQQGLLQQGLLQGPPPWWPWHLLGSKSRCQLLSPQRLRPHWLHQTP